MNEDNTKLGFYYSLSLHIIVTVAAVLAVLVQNIFPKKEPVEPTPFELVDPKPEDPQEVPAPIQPQQQPQETQPQPLRPIEPIKLPQPETESEPEPQPTPKPEPEPAPSPKPIKKPEPPKKVSFADFAKTNPKKKTSPAPSTPRTAPSKPVKYTKVTASTGNLDRISTITVKGGSSTAMRSLLDSYVAEIKRRAKGNWAVPVTAQGVDYVTKVEFRVSRTGAISGLRIVESSGSTEFDNSVMAAMRSISLPPPPDNEDHTVTIKFTVD